MNPSTETPRAEMKPRFGDLVENSSAGVGNPQKRGFFVRFIGRASDRRWQLTDGEGEFWEVYETVSGYPNHRLTVVSSVNSKAELVEALKEILAIARNPDDTESAGLVIMRVDDIVDICEKALTAPETE